MGNPVAQHDLGGGKGGFEKEELMTSLTYGYVHMGGFLKWWYPTTMGFPTKNDHFGVFLGVPPFKETPIS